MHESFAETGRGQRRSHRRTVVRQATSPRYLGNPLQNDHRDDSLRLLWIVAESREHIAVRLVETIALGPFRDRRRAHLELLRADFDLALAMLHQVVVPAGMCRCAALRRRDDVAPTIAVLDERRRAHHAALRPARREEQEVIAPGLDTSSALCVELVDNARVPVRHGYLNPFAGRTYSPRCAESARADEGPSGVLSVARSAA